MSVRKMFPWLGSLVEPVAAPLSAQFLRGFVVQAEMFRRPDTGLSSVSSDDTAAALFGERSSLGE